MKILAIETATEACSVALLIDDQITIEFEHAPRQHTQLILPMLDKVLAEAEIVLADVDAIAFGRGPGAFTGLRIAAGVTQGLALATELPVIGISTLAALAQQVYETHQDTHILTALDARINEVYWGQYIVEQGRVVLDGEEKVILPHEISSIHSEQWAGVGSGWAAYSDELHAVAKGHLKSIYADIEPSAEYIAKLAVYKFAAGNLLSVEEAQPIYLRDKVAQTIAERKKNAK